MIKTSGSLGHSTLLCSPSTMTYKGLETLRMIVVLVGIKAFACAQVPSVR